jgi:hypothetical protein
MARGGGGTGRLIPRLPEAAGMPVATGGTPAHGAERAPVRPWLGALRGRTGTRGRPRKRLKVLVTDPGDDAKALRQQLRTRGIRAPIPTRVWGSKPRRGSPIPRALPRFPAERTVAWFQKKARRVVVRGERLAVCFRACLAIAMIPMWLQRFIAG